MLALTVVVPLTASEPRPLMVPPNEALPVTVRPKPPPMIAAWVVMVEPASVLVPVRVRVLLYVCVALVVTVPLTFTAFEAVRFFTPLMLPGSVKGVLKFSVRLLFAAVSVPPSVSAVPLRDVVFVKVMALWKFCVVPVVKVPASEMPEGAVTSRAPPTVAPAMMMLLASTSVALLAPLLVTVTAPVKSLPALLSDTAPALPVRVTAPAVGPCVIAPLWEMPTPLRLSVPVPTVTPPRLRMELLVIDTLFTPVLLTVTAPVKLLVAFVRVTGPLPPLIVTAPALAAWLIGPVCVRFTAVRFSVPVPSVMPPMTRPFLSVSATLLLPLLVTVTAPVKSFNALVSVTAAALPVIVTAPAAAAWTMAPVWVRPRALRPSVPVPRVRVPRVRLLLLVSATLLLPLFVTETAPVKLFPALVSATGPALPVMVTAPALAAWVIAPVCVRFTALMPSVPVPSVMPPMTRPFLSVSATLFAPLFVTVTAPVKSLPTLLSVIGLDPAANDEVPEIVRAPVWVMAPLEVAASAPVRLIVELKPMVPPLALRTRPVLPSEPVIAELRAMPLAAVSVRLRPTPLSASTDPVTVIAPVSVPFVGLPTVVALVLLFPRAVWMDAQVSTAAVPAAGMVKLGLPVTFVSVALLIVRLVRP